MAEILKQYPKISHHYLEKKSRARARNYLIPTLEENYIAYIDADVTLDKDWVNHCLKRIQGVHIAAVGCSIYRVGKTFIDKVRRESSRRSFLYANTLETGTTGLCLNTAATLIKTQSLRAIGMFNPSFVRCEDTELTCRMLLNGYHIASTTQGKAYVTRSDKLLAYLITTPFWVGYFAEKISTHYPVKSISLIKRYWRSIRRIFSINSLNGYAVEAILSWQSFLHITGTFIGRIRFYGMNKKEPFSRSNLTKFLSHNGHIYILNPNLAACLRKNDLLLVTLQEQYLVYLLKDEEAKTLSHAIQTGVIIQNDALENLLKKNIILAINC